MPLVYSGNSCFAAPIDLRLVVEFFPHAKGAGKSTQQNFTQFIGGENIGNENVESATQREAFVNLTHSLLPARDKLMNVFIKSRQPWSQNYVLAIFVFFFWVFSFLGL